MEREVMETVLHEILHELRGQKAQLDQLHNSMKEQENTTRNFHGKPAQPALLSSTFSDDQLVWLENFITQHFETLKEEIAKNPAVSHTHKHISLVPLAFRMEYFPMLVNTVMKWVVLLIVLVFLMWLAVSIINPV